MSRHKAKAPLSTRDRKQSFTESVRVPRSLVVVVVLLFGLILFLAAFSDPSGEMRKLGPGAYLYILVLAALAAATGYSGRNPARPKG